MTKNRKEIKMSEKYYTVTVKLNEDDLKEYLSNFYDEEDIEDMNLQDEATEAIKGVLSNEFSDFYCIDKNTLVVGDFLND